MRARSKPFLSCLSCLAVVLLVLGNASASEFNPYSVLGVSRHASQPEIRKAYKQLVKEWHPDKNKDPSAEDMFIKITKSYEILSSEDRRANYDQFGQTDESPHGFRHFHDSFYFDQSFFRFTQSTRDFTDSKHLLQYEKYMKEVVPDSFKRPYLIKITSEWCFSCIHLEPFWKETIQDLEPLGVGIGVVDIGYEKRLANHLGARSAPSILALINGRVTLFHNSVSRENLRHFVESLLPNNLVEKVTDDDYVQFLNSWREENKPRVLLFDAAASAPFIYKLSAFAYRDFVRFGYVDLSETTRIQQQFSINMYAPTMLLFKENTEKPADAIQSRGMKRQTIDEFVSSNRFLLVPRLVNQKLFDELCPVKQFHRRRKYCVLLITEEDETFESVNDAFFDFASSNTKEVVRFAYVYQRQQQALCDALLKMEDMRPPQVIILERRSASGKVLYRTMTGGWNGSDDDKHRLHEQLELLQRDPTFLTYDAMLPELNNELASNSFKNCHEETPDSTGFRPAVLANLRDWVEPDYNWQMFLIRWMNAACDYLSQAYFDLFYSNWREVMPIVSLIFSALFILFGTVIIQAFSDSEEKTAKRKAKESPKKAGSSSDTENTSSRPPKKNFVEVTELTDVTYTSNLVKLKPGHINVVLVLTDTSKQVLLKKFAKEVYSFSGYQTLHYSFFNTDKHSQWMDSLLELVPSASLSEEDQDEDASSSCKPDYTGYVLALNGHKKYFCLFRPTINKDEENTVQLQHKLDQLNLWMEKLTEGTLSRHYVPAWPDLQTATPNK